MRINRFLALAGLGSRRSAESLIREGRVTVNGKLVSDLSTVVSEADRVKVNGRLIQPEAFSYILLHKPRGYEVTRSKTPTEKSIYSLLPPALHHLSHVGRLDVDSDGLILLMNDGELAHRLSHPRFKVEKEYVARLDRPFESKDLPRALRGVYLSEGKARFDRLRHRGHGEVEVVLTQGLNRQVRRVFAALGYKVRALTRVRIGPLRLGGLEAGRFRSLRSREVEGLKTSTHAEVRSATPSGDARLPARTGPRRTESLSRQTAL